METQPHDFTWLFDNYQSFFDVFEMDRENIIEVYYEWKEGPEDTVLKYLWDIFEKLNLKNNLICCNLNKYALIDPLFVMSRLLGTP